MAGYFRSLAPGLVTYAAQRNVAAVASRWRHCMRPFDLPEVESHTSRIVAVSSILRQTVGAAVISFAMQYSSPADQIISQFLQTCCLTDVLSRKIIKPNLFPIFNDNRF